MRAKTMKMTYDGVKYAVTAKKNRDLTTEIDFTMSEGPNGYGKSIWSFQGKLPKDVPGLKAHLAKAMRR